MGIIGISAGPRPPMIRTQGKSEVELNATLHAQNSEPAPPPFTDYAGTHNLIYLNEHPISNL